MPYKDITGQEDDEKAYEVLTRAALGSPAKREGLMGINIPPPPTTKSRTSGRGDLGEAAAESFNDWFLRK